MLRYFLVLRLLVLKWSLSTGMWMKAHEARNCRFHRHVHAGTGGTKVWVLQPVREPRDRQVSFEARECKHRRHVNEAHIVTEMLLVEARVSTLWMYKSAVAEACVRMLG